MEQKYCRVICTPVCSWIATASLRAALKLEVLEAGCVMGSLSCTCGSHIGAEGAQGSQIEIEDDQWWVTDSLMVSVVGWWVTDSLSSNGALGGCVMDSLSRNGH